MIRNQFYQDPNGGYAKFSNKKVFDNVWKKVLAYEEKTGLCLDDGFTKEQYIDLFSSMKVRRTITLPNCKLCVMAYVRYLVNNNALPPEQEDILASVEIDDVLLADEGSGVQYYKDLNMLRNAIQDTIRSSESYDESRFYPWAVALYLAWYGLSEEEIINYPKEDVLDDGIMIHGQKLEIPFDILQIFTRLRDAEGYYQQARGVIFRTYLYSDYLIRTEYKEQITPQLLRSALARFDIISGKVYSLRYNVVHMSGIFNRMYRMENDGFQLNLSDPEVASRVFCEDLSNVTKRHFRIRDYNLYKQLYN